MAAGLIVAAAVSWHDDRTPLAPIIRLPLHLAAAAMFVLSLPGEALVFQGLLPIALDRALAILALAWMMNLYNFMDGINGIAGAEAVAITGGYVLLALSVPAAVSYAPLATALLGATLGFLSGTIARKATRLFSWVTLAAFRSGF